MRANTISHLSAIEKRLYDQRHTLLAWTQLYRPFLSPSLRFDIANHKYMLEPYLIGHDEEERPSRMVFKKSGQSGVSEWAIGYAFQTCDIRRVNVLHVMPTIGDVSDFSQMRFGPALDASPYLRTLLVSAAKTKEGGNLTQQKGADRVNMKRIRDNFIVFRGGRITKDGRSNQLKSVPADVVILDELDEMDMRVVPMAEKRLGHAKRQGGEMIKISTPTYTGFGIDGEYKQSDQRRWFIPCPKCGEWQSLTIDSVVYEWNSLKQPERWHGMADGRAYPACLECRAELNRLADGEWVASYPKREARGYHISKLFDPRANVLKIVRGLQTANQDKRKEIMNQDLGEPFTPRGGRLTDAHLDNCKRPYGIGPDVSIQPFAGIDVGTVFTIVIRAREENGRSRLLYAGEIIDEEEVIGLLRRYQVQGFVIDGLPETRISRRIQASFPEGVGWLAFYSMSDIDKKLEWNNFNEEEGIVNLARTRSLDDTFAKFYEKRATLPEMIGDVEHYVAQMKAPVRVLERNAKNIQVPRYVEDGPDHFAHAENYCNAAFLRPVYVVDAEAMVTELDI